MYKDLRNINVAKAEEEAALEEPPPEMEDLTETTTDQTVETEVLNDISNPSLDNLQTPTDVVTPFYAPLLEFEVRIDDATNIEDIYVWYTTNTIEWE